MFIQIFHLLLQVKSRQGKIVSEKSDVSLSWMLYVKPARDRHEQNLEAFRDVNGRIFFRSIRSIEAGDQLFVWYSDQFAMEIGIPPLTPDNIQGWHICFAAFKLIVKNRSAHLTFKEGRKKYQILTDACMIFRV